MSDLSLLKNSMTDIFRKTPGNVIAEDSALEGCGGLVLFEEPIFGFADADDELFEEFRKPEIIGGPYMGPKEWLPSAKTVISFFLPFTEAVRKSNYGNPAETSNGWLHGRIEGQSFLEQYLKNLKAYFESCGIDVCAPYFDERFRIQRDDPEEGASRIQQDAPGDRASWGDDSCKQQTAPGYKDTGDIHFSCSWSERHTAFAAGLGTFSLTRGLITEKGVAGRFGSLIVSEKYEPTKRPYHEVEEYCIRCGACIERCPAGAITLEHGKNQILCRQWVEDHTAKVYYPRYGCGKCQTNVPCEYMKPEKK